MKTKITLIAVVISALFMTGCGIWPFGNSERDTDEVPDNEQLLYEEAQKAIRSGNYTVGIERLGLIETHFPFGKYAEQAQLELIYAHIRKGDFDATTLAADRFIDLHPQHPNVDYAYFLKGLVSFERNRGFFDRFLGSPEYLRDTSDAKQAFTNLNELLTKYPDSMYAKDARLRMIHLRNVIALAEVNIASFYLSRESYVAAANRADGVVNQFPESQAVPDALSILVEANFRLGLNEAANDALRILQLNFPNYKGFNPEGNLELTNQLRNRERSLLNVMSFGLLDRPVIPPPLEMKLPEIQPPHRQSDS